MAKVVERFRGETVRVKELDIHTTDRETVITPENVKYLGENIAIYTLKCLFAYRGMIVDDIYYGLIKDIHLMQNHQRPISDGYDYAQEAICFLCGHMGEKLGDTVIGKYKKPVSLFHACSSAVGNYFYKQYGFIKNTRSIERKDKVKTDEPFEENNTEEQLANVEKTIEGMNLSERQTNILNLYMQDKGVTEIANLLSVCLATVWRDRQAIMQKYMNYMR